MKRIFVWSLVIVLGMIVGCGSKESSDDRRIEALEKKVEALEKEISTLRGGVTREAARGVRRVVADEQRAKGLVKYRGQWMAPSERDKKIQESKERLERIKQLAAERKKFEEDQKSKGLVLFRGKWVTPEEKKQLLQQETINRPPVPGAPRQEMLPTRVEEPPAEEAPKPE